MTVDEKRNFIRKHCSKSVCSDCVLSNKKHCAITATPEEVNENYSILVGNNCLNILN